MQTKAILFFLTAAMAALLSRALPDDYSKCPACPAKSASVWPSLDVAFKSATWIWTTEANFATAYAPVSTRPFRKTYTSVKRVTSARVHIGADNRYALYFNGHLIGSQTDLTVQGDYSIGKDIVNPCTNVIAINAVNDPGPGDNPAGVIAAVQFNFSDGSSDIIITESSWRTLTATSPSGFEAPNFNDANWVSSRVLGGYGRSPWSQLGYA